MIETLENIAVLLVGTKHPGNLGSVARAMRNMGLQELRLVAPQCEIDEESFRMAKAGQTVLRAAKKFQSLKSAIRGLHLLVGTSGKTGGNRIATGTPRDLAPEIIAHASRHKVGLIFGPEDTGLVDSDLILSQMLIRIPTHPLARSINLAQAVLIVSYELFLASLERRPARVPDLPPVQQVEAMYEQLEQSLLDIGFLHDQNAQHMMFAIRRMLGRADLEAADIGILRGIARQIAWAAKRTRPD